MSFNILQSLQNTFGGVPPMVTKHMKYFTYDKDREEFFCKLCEKTIQKYSPSTLEAHLKSASHTENSCPAEQVTAALTNTFQGKIPQIVRNNIKVMDVVEGAYECVICEKTLNVSWDPKVCVNTFSYHLTSLGHERNLTTYQEQLQTLINVYGEIPEIVNNNKEFLRLTRSGKNYVCSLCNVLLEVQDDQEDTENEFDQHFQSPQHIWSAKKSKVLSITPTFHSYLMRNIDFLTKNGTYFFCSLCHVNIKHNLHDPDETEENLKHHMLSSAHEENVFSKLNEDNLKHGNLSKVMGIFTDDVLKNLRYLELRDNDLICSVCNEEFDTEHDELSANIALHFYSGIHQSNVSEKECRRNNVLESLEHAFGGIPLFVEENLPYIEFVRDNIFLCTLCEVQFLSKNVERHLRCNKHTQAKEEEDSFDSMVEGLQYLLGEEYEDEIPECIYNNWSNLEYDTEDDGNFFCTLCNEIILVDEGNRKEEITLQNFKRHLLSAEHNAKLKGKARNKIIVLEELELVFGGIPKCILNNLHVLCVNDKDSFYCDECEVVIKLGSSVMTSTRNFLQHLRGKPHRTNIECTENSIDEAFKYIDEIFGVPECLLKDIDFWDNLYCTLCQLELPVDIDDLKETRMLLECHVSSEHHKTNLNYL